MQRELSAPELAKLHDDKKTDCLCVIVIFIGLIARFWKTVFLAKPISLLYLISVWDSLFFALKTGQSTNIDASLIELHLPYRFFVADCWRHGIPLWNELSGFGMPLLADPQAFVLSPLYSLFHLIPTIYIWNITLVVELFIGAACTYFLCRELELDAVSSMVASALFSFCPWIQFQLELLGNGNCLVPLVFLCFVRAAKSRSSWHTVGAGVAAAIDILSAHPEVSCITILFASLLMCLIAYYQDRSNFNLRILLGKIALAGMVAFGLCAPLLLPFAEYIHNGQTYKLDGQPPANISLESLVASYLCFYFSASGLYLGPLSWFGLTAFACFPKSSNRFATAMIVCLAVSVLAVTRLFPVSLIFLLPLLSTVQVSYCIPEYLLFLAIVSALGMDKLINGFVGISKRNGITAFVSVMIFILLPLTLYSGLEIPSLHFDPTLEPNHLNIKVWLFNTCCTGGMLILFWSKRLTGLKAHFGSYLCFLILGSFNLVSVASVSLPVRPMFQYPGILPLQINGENGGRFVSLGDHLFRPNTNLVYKLSTPRVVNPLFPLGFVPFMKACGAQVDEFAQVFPATISRIFDLTGTTTIVSEQPLLDDEAVRKAYKGKSIVTVRSDVVNYPKILRLDDINLFRDRNQDAIFCKMLCTPDFQSRAASYHLYCELKNERGLAEAFIEPQQISGLYRKQLITFSAFLPKASKHWILTLKLVSDLDGHCVIPDFKKTTLSVNSTDGTCMLAQSHQSERFTDISDGRFVPIARYGTSIVAYKNKTAMNRCFFANAITWVKTSEDAVHYLENESNDIRNVAVLEESQREQFEKVVRKIHSTQSSGLSMTFDQSGHVELMDAGGHSGHYIFSSRRDIYVDSPNSSLIVVSDLYYPGWLTTLDSQPWDMFRADGIFRAVLVPPGRHHVRFVYCPLSFLIGVIFSTTTIAVLLWQRFRR
jgi:hypothetical protein